MGLRTGFETLATPASCGGSEVGSAMAPRHARLPACARLMLRWMARLSQLFLPTLKDPPADAEAISHKLMVRAGLIRQLGAGLWTYLPAGWRVHRKAEQIIREEMDSIGGQEMLMPVSSRPRSGRRRVATTIDELFKLEDRRGSELVLAMTHEENLTSTGAPRSAPTGTCR